ncbi:S8 family serine peptidase [Lysobacter enzymogenes]|uniref:S8 family serine peptidase n=1 Tax=Lysobacter enzymogenes TaxID=69 RepID=UPI00384AD227
MNNRFASKEFAVLGLAAACAAALLWMRQEAPPAALGAAGAHVPGADAHASGALPAAALRPVSSVAPVPLSNAQSKLGSGQLLAAVQSFARDPAVAASAAGAPGRSAAQAARNLAAQIAALDRVGIPARFRDGEKVKVNVDLALSVEDIADPNLLDRATAALRDTLLGAGVSARQVNGSPTLEASVPLAQLEWVAGLQPVAQVSLMAMTTTAAFSDGATASDLARLSSLGNDPGVAEALRRDLHGEGLTIAIVDHFNNLDGAVQALQKAGEWPANSTAAPAKLTMTGSGKSAFGNRGEPHGNAVTEIVYDIAPEANFRLYDSSGAADWVSAVQDAANLNAKNEPLGEPRAQVITSSLGFNLYGPGDGTGTGSGLKGLYEAIDAAKANGVIVLNAAGNEAQVHWDGDSTAGAGANVLQDFVVGDVDANGVQVIESVNPLSIGGGYNGCIPVGAKSAQDKAMLEFAVSLGWNDWTSAGNATDADYKLELVRWADEVTKRQYDRVTRTYKTVVVTPAGWTVAAQSDAAQSGRAGQTPLETIAYQAPAADKTVECDAVGFNAERFAGGGKFGVRITRKSAAASNFLRMFSGLYDFGYVQTERSLIHPADSASVITVAALDAATSNLESYSSRGPVLAAGGARPAGQAAGNAKPDLANFANVDTVSYGDNVFNGTSSATPHVAALALLGLQHQRQLTDATVPAPLPADATKAQKDARAALLKQRNVALADVTYDALVKVASTGGNDLGEPGFDASYGNGRLKFHANSQSCFLSALYEQANRSLLPVQEAIVAAPVAEGEDAAATPAPKTYDQLLAENSAACAAQ